MDMLIEFSKNPPHGVKGLVTFVKDIQPDYIRVRVEGRAAAVLASTNVLGAESKVTIDVAAFEKVAVKLMRRLGIDV